MKKFQLILGRISLRSAAVAAILFLSLSAGQASAAITSVNVNPTAVRLNVIAPQTLSVTWRVQITDGLPVIISSSSGEIRVDGAVVAVPNGLLSRSVPSRLAPITVVFTETLRVSRAVARRISEGGAIDYRRTFVEDGFTPESAMISIRPTLSGPILVRDLDLRFDDDSQYRIVDQSERLFARAEIASIGSGVLEGRWEHAGPGSISTGEPAFQILSREQRALGGSRRALLRSPPLPTALPGLHIVRFRPLRLDRRAIIDQRDILEIRYVVRPDGDSGRIALISPDETAPLSPATRFTWQSIPSAAHHRLEFLTAGAGPIGDRSDLVAAVDLPGAGNSARLRPFTLRRLETGAGSIYWRISAFDAQGNRIAVSPLRRLLQTPISTRETR